MQATTKVSSDTDSLLAKLVRSNHYLGQLDQAVAIANANATPAAHDPALAGAYALLFLDAEDAGGASRWAAAALRLDPRSIDGSLTEATMAIMRLQTDRAQQLFDAVLETALETGRAWSIGGQNQSALSRLLLRRPKH